MTKHELMTAMADVMDDKLQPMDEIKSRVKKIELTQENEILPRLQSIVKNLK